MVKLTAYNKSGTTGWISDELLSGEEREILADPETLLRKPIKIFKKEKNKLTCLIESPLDDIWLIKSDVIKSFYGFKPLQKLYHRFYFRNLLSRVNGLALQGLPLSPFYACLFQEGPVGRYYLISEGYLDCSNLALIARENKQQFEQLIKQGLMNQLVETLANFHKLGYCHGDMKWSNIIFLADNDYRFIDVEHLKKPIISFRQGLYFKDLARFIVSAYEAGLTGSQLKAIIEKYAEFRSMDYKTVVKKIQPQIQKISARKKISKLQSFEQFLEIKTEN